MATAHEKEQPHAWQARDYCSCALRHWKRFCAPLPLGKHAVSTFLHTYGRECRTVRDGPRHAWRRRDDVDCARFGRGRFEALAVGAWALALSAVGDAACRGIGAEFSRRKLGDGNLALDLHCHKPACARHVDFGAAGSANASLVSFDIRTVTQDCPIGLELKYNRRTRTKVTLNEISSTWVDSVIAELGKPEPKTWRLPTPKTAPFLC
jgi:hypothetical protein